MSRCHQCSNSAMVEVGPSTRRIALCLGCWQRLQQTVIATDQMYQRQIDMLMEQAEMITGISIRPPRPAPTIVQGPVTHHNIRIDRSVVGAVNTGHVQSLNVSLDRISQVTDGELSKKMTQFTESVLSDPTLTPQNKKDVVEQLAFVMEEARKPAGDRKKSIVLSTLKNVATTVGAIKGLKDLWSMVEPAIQLLF